MLLSGAALAHAPHDHVTSIVLSDAFSLDQTAFAIVRGNLLRSVDGGLTWWRATRGLPLADCLQVRLSPRFGSDGESWACLDRPAGLFRGSDFGRSWSVLPGPPGIAIAIAPFGAQSDSPSVLLLVRDGAVFLARTADYAWVGLPLPESSVTAIAAAAETVAIGTGDGTVLSSTDRGATWDTRRTTPPSRVTTILLDEKTGCLLACGTHAGVFLLTRRTGVEDAHPVLRGRITALARLPISRGSEGIGPLAAAEWHRGIFVSNNRGRDWRWRGRGLTREDQADEPAYRQPHFGCLAAPVAAESGRTLFVGGFDGLFRSENRGRRWSELKGTLREDLIVGFDVERSGPDTSIVMTTYTSGIRWAARRSPRHWHIRSPVPNRPRAFGIALASQPATPPWIVTVVHGSVARSRLDGTDWEQIPFGLPGPSLARSRLGVVAHVKSIAKRLIQPLPRPVRRAIRSTLTGAERHMTAEKSYAPFGAGLRGADLRADGWPEFVGLRRHGIFQIDPAGSAYRHIWDTEPRTLYDFQISPDFRADQTVIAALSDGVYRSADGGYTWHATGAPPSLSDAMLALTSSGSRPATIFLAHAGGLLRSHDGGYRWTPLTFRGAGQVTPVSCIAVSPGCDYEALAFLPGHGLYRSVDYADVFIPVPLQDNSLSFTRMAGFQDNITLIRYSDAFAADRTVFATSMECLWVSVDGGDTWDVAFPIDVPTTHISSLKT